MLSLSHVLQLFNPISLTFLINICFHNLGEFISFRVLKYFFHSVHCAFQRGLHAEKHKEWSERSIHAVEHSSRSRLVFLSVVYRWVISPSHECPIALGQKGKRWERKNKDTYNSIGILELGRNWVMDHGSLG